MMIDEAMRTLFDKSYDANGETASVGQLHYELFNELCAHPYLKRLPPKSTGREDFGQAYVQDILSRYHEVKAEDIIATFTRFTAFCIFDSTKNIARLDRLIIGGGGAHNACLMKDIQSYFPETEVLRQEDLGYSSDAKEAIAFVILANQTLHRQPSNVPSATGAKTHVILGKITPVPEGF
jgi:anhydro-N-acetylmuramic acid kinase